MLSDLFESHANANSDAPTSIRSQIIAQILTDARPRLTKLVDEIEDDTINHELDLRRHTDAQLEEDLDNYRIDIASTKEDALIEVCHEVEKITEEFLNAVIMGSLIKQDLAVDAVNAPRRQRFMRELPPL